MTRAPNNFEMFMALLVLNKKSQTIAAQVKNENKIDTPMIHPLNRTTIELPIICPVPPALLSPKLVRQKSALPSFGDAQ